MLRTALLLALAASLVGGCKPRFAPRPLELTGYYLDGTGLDVGTLRGKPWVITLWMPG